MARLLSVVILVVVLGLPFSSRAQTPTKREWYGWQNLLVLIVSHALAVTSVPLFLQHEDVGASIVLGLGVGGHLFGSGFVHIANGEPEHGGNSFLLHFGLPVAGAIAALPALSNCRSDGICMGTGIGVGSFIGLAAAVAVDLGLNSTRKKREVVFDGSTIRMTF